MGSPRRLGDSPRTRNASPGRVHGAERTRTPVKPNRDNGRTSLPRPAAGNVHYSGLTSPCSRKPVVAGRTAQTIPLLPLARIEANVTVDQSACALPATPQAQAKVPQAPQFRKKSPARPRQSPKLERHQRYRSYEKLDPMLEMIADPDGNEHAKAAARHVELIRGNEKRQLHAEAIRSNMVRSKLDETSSFIEQLRNVLAVLNAAENLRKEGIHRIPGSQSQIEAAIKSSRHGAALAIKDPAVASGVLKELFKLPFGDDGTLIPESVSLGLLAMKRNGRSTEEIASCFMEQMPETNRVAFLKILSHLAKVAQHADDNKMGAKNLGIVFGPRLYEPAVTDPMELPNHTDAFAKVMQLLIEKKMAGEI